jgi:hypothetical protein
MQERSKGIFNRENIGTGIEIGGVVVGLIGLLRFNFWETALGGVIFYGGHKLKESGKK